jgi:hypothetical protein
MIFVLANTMALAIRILKIINELDIRSFIMNVEIDNKLLDESR